MPSSHPRRPGPAHRVWVAFALLLLSPACGVWAGGGGDPAEGPGPAAEGAPTAPRLDDAATRAAEQDSTAAAADSTVEVADETAGNGDEGATAPVEEVVPPEPAGAWAEVTLEGLTLREKVGQLLMPWVLGDYAPDGSAS